MVCLHNQYKLQVSEVSDANGAEFPLLLLKISQGFGLVFRCFIFCKKTINKTILTMVCLHNQYKLQVSEVSDASGADFPFFF
jgi:hypothetical protein